MQIKQLFFFKLLDFQLNSSTQKNSNSKSITQKFPQMVVKVIWNCRPMFKFFFPTLNANIFQSIWSNFMKFLLHDLRQVKYKILWLYFKESIFFLGWMQQNRQFCDFGPKNGLSPIGVKSYQNWLTFVSIWC